MSVNGVTNSNTTNNYQNYNNGNQNKGNTEPASEDVAAVYEQTGKQTYTMDLDKVKQLKTELSDKSKQMQGLVNALFKGQGKKSFDVVDLIKGLRNGSLNVSPEMVTSAQAEVADDGYWGVEKTSDRLLEMAKALSGGDKSKADMLITAMEKGFKMAQKDIGGDLPDICSQTMDAARQKITEWRDS